MAPFYTGLLNSNKNSKYSKKSDYKSISNSEKNYKNLCKQSEEDLNRIKNKNKTDWPDQPY